MVTLSSIIPALEQGDWFLALDHKDTYFRITIHPAHRQFLQLILGDSQYQHKVLPFRLYSTPRVFSKVLAVTAAYLRKQGVVIFPYVGDCLFKATSETYAL